MSLNIPAWAAGKEKEFLTLSQAAALLPRRRQGRKVAASTVYRWAKYGLNDVYLQVSQVGGGLCTTREFLDKFFDDLTRAKGLHRAHKGSKANDPTLDAQLAAKGLLAPENDAM